MKTRGRWKRHQGGRIHGIWQEMSWSRGGGGEMETAEAMPRISGEWLRRCSYHERPVGGSRGWKGLRWTGGRLQPSVWGFLTAKCWDALQTQKREDVLADSNRQSAATVSEDPGLGEVQGGEGGPWAQSSLEYLQDWAGTLALVLLSSPMGLWLSLHLVWCPLAHVWEAHSGPLVLTQQFMPGTRLQLWILK